MSVVLAAIVLTDVLAVPPRAPAVRAPIVLPEPVSVAGRVVAFVPVSISVPALTRMPPVNVLLAESCSMPAPVLLMPTPEPETTAAILRSGAAFVESLMAKVRAK